MDFKDYYKILGVEKTATTDEIKKAYRKMAIKFHPDNNPNNKKAEEKFKEINDANGVLSDAEQRKKFDELSEDWSKYQQSGGKQNFEGFRHSNQHNGNVYQSDEGSRARGYSSGEQFNEEDFSDLFSSLFGGKQSRGRQTQPSKGQDYTTEIQITLEEAYSGITRQLDLETEKFQLTIKPGIQNKQRLRLKGKGGKGMNGAANGDLYITVNVAENQQYQRKGDDLYSSISIDLYTAILGGEAIVKTLRNPIKVPIAKETDNGKQLRMKGMGMPKYNKENEFGDLYVTISITMPKNLSEKEIELFKELSLLNQT